MPGSARARLRAVARHATSCASADASADAAAVDVVVVGAGVNGIGTARRLAAEGLAVTVLERQGEVGGIWSEFANDTSRSQNHEPAYRLGPSVGSEDYTVKGNVIADLWRGARETGIAGRIRCGVEVVRVIDEPGAESVRVVYREGAAGEPRELSCGHVIFCTGSLQRPRNPPLPGEEAFGGPVVLGLGSAVNDLSFSGKTVTVIGMGAFAIENARLALLNGAAHVHMVARTLVYVTSRLTRVLNILSSAAFYHPRGEGVGEGLPPVGDRMELMRRQYYETSATASLPGHSDHSSTPWTTSDIFFLGHALGRLSVHKGTVESLAPGVAVVAVGEGAEGAGETREIQCDCVIKNLGFDGVDLGDRMGGICDVVGHRSCRPPIWITERVLTFRHQTDLPRDLPRAVADQLGREALRAELQELSVSTLQKRAAAAGLTPSAGEEVGELRLEERLVAGSEQSDPDSGAATEDWRGGGVEGDWVGPNWVGSASHGCGVWTELFLHFRRHPDALAALFEELPRTALSATGGSDIGRGMRTVLSSDAELLARVNANRKRLNDNTFKYYARPGATLEEAQEAWVGGFLERNRADWEEACEAMTGERLAVPYLWEGLAQELELESWTPQQHRQQQQEEAEAATAAAAERVASQ